MGQDGYLPTLMQLHLLGFNMGAYCAFGMHTLGMLTMLHARPVLLTVYSAGYHHP